VILFDSDAAGIGAVKKETIFWRQVRVAMNKGGIGRADDIEG